MAARLRLLFTNPDRGQALIEYSLIIALIVVIIIIMLIIMGNTVKNMFCNVAGSLTT